MAATTGITVREQVQIQVAAAASSKRARRISPQAGRALEILGHAIEYLADEYANEAKEFSARDPQVEAIQMLMALNRRIYFDCPVVPKFSERLRAFFDSIMQ